MSNEITVYTDPSTGVTREYRQVRRRAQVGELAIAIDPHGVGANYRNGEIFTVWTSDNNDVSDGRAAGYLTHNSRYVVLEPTDVVVHDGKRYREVKRKATVGDKVIITKSRDNRWANGEVYTVIAADRKDVFIRHPKGMNSTHGGANLFDSEYTVLEPLDTVGDDTVVHNGQKYRKVSRKAKLGELVMITYTKDPRYPYFRVADIGQVIDFAWDGDPLVDFRNRGNFRVFEDGRWYVGLGQSASRYNVLEPLDVPQPITQRYAKPGDRIRIVRVYPTRPLPAIDGISHGLRTDFNVGDEFIVKRVTDDGKVYIAEPYSRAIIYPQEYVVLDGDDAAAPATPSLVDNVVQLRSDVDALTKRVDALDRKTTIRAVAERAADGHAEALGRMVDKPLTGPHPFMACTYTRAQVIEMAKADVETLLRTVVRNVPVLVRGGRRLGYYDPSIDTVNFDVDRKTRTVVASINTDHREGSPWYCGTWARGTATCAPDDCFNVHIGKAISLRKALGKPVPTYYTHAPQPMVAEVGDIVEIYGNQRWKAVDGDRRYGCYELPVRSLNAWLTGHMSTCGGNARIVDDSHDFGGERP